MTDFSSSKNFSSLICDKKFCHKLLMKANLSLKFADVIFSNEFVTDVIETNFSDEFCHSIFLVVNVVMSAYISAVGLVVT